MLKSILLSLAGLIIVGLLVLREWSVLKELDTLQSDINQELLLQLEGVESFQRLSQVTQSNFSYERFLEPVVLSANKLVWPPLRNQKILAWERRVHQLIADTSFEKTTELRKKIEEQISSLRLEKNPGRDRLLEVSKLAQGLDSEQDRFDFIQMELDDIQKQMEMADKDLIEQIKRKGVDRLQTLHRDIQGFEDPELVDYIASADFFKGIMEPVSQLVLQIRQQSLRAKTWEEFQKNLSRVLSRKKRQLANIRSHEDPSDSFEGLAELLKREYEREKQREISLEDQQGRPTIQELN